MSGFLDSFRRKVISSVFKENVEEKDVVEINDKIALGVLLYVVAESDDQVLEAELNKIKEILRSFAKIEEDDLQVIMKSIEIAASQRIDLFTFTKEVGNDLPRDVKISIIENLFRVACIDQDLDEREQEMIRKISGLFRLDHDEFINTKIKVKKEFGMDTAGL